MTCNTRREAICCPWRPRGMAPIIRSLSLEASHETSANNRGFALLVIWSLDRPQYRDGEGKGSTRSFRADQAGKIPSSNAGPKEEVFRIAERNSRQFPAGY